MHTDYFILGAGGHAKVVLDLMACLSIRPLVYDNNIELKGSIVLGYEIEYLDSYSELPKIGHIAIGDNHIRFTLTEKLSPFVESWSTLIHPSSCIAKFVELDDGVLIAAGSVIGPESFVSKGTIVNHRAVVDHDCRIGEYCHIAPNATLGGGVVLGDFVLVGSGATILPGINIGSNVVIGSGAVVTKDIADNQRVAGIPARGLL
ncbi:acetyltransferase [Aliamphritea hakodatensis]|uniref:acetyltransferase n=1 Tax=Aliamphritea hakodatensis TaxID=2895352 RepID=UPI0022FD4021|nr:acetyltransferase [Aliamphritea hakodatensis]